jgi:hypothetical protein
MIDEALNTITHDLEYTAYDCALISDVAQVMQSIKIRLLWIFGEWFRDTRRGVPFFQDEFTKGDHALVESLLKATILETPEVRNLLSFSTTYDAENRKYTVEFSADTIYGTAEDNINLNIGIPE